MPPFAPPPAPPTAEFNPATTRFRVRGIKIAVLLDLLDESGLIVDQGESQPTTLLEAKIPTPIRAFLAESGFARGLPALEPGTAPPAEEPT